MEADLQNLEPGAIGDIAESLPPAVAAENAHTAQSSSTDRQSVEPPVDTGAADVTLTPSGPTAEDIDASSAAGFREKFPEIADFIKSCTSPSLNSTKWCFLDEGDPRLRIGIETLEFVGELQQEYGADVLVEFGLYERVGDELRLPSWLDGEAPLYVTIDADESTLRFYHDSGFLFPITRTAADYAVEHIPPDCTQAPGTLFIADSQDAVEVMQRLGLRAVSSEGLEALGRDDVQRLFAGDHRSDVSWRYYLLILDFDVVRLEKRPSAAIGEVIKRLADAADVYGIDPARRFGVCRPSAHEFQVLERAITFQDSARICQLFEAWSAAAKSAKINSWRTHLDTEVASFSVARAALVRALERSEGVARRAEVLVALPAFRAACQAAVIEKFHKAIDSASDPFDTLDLIAATGCAETFLDSDPLVRAGEAVLAGQTPPSGRELQNESLEQRLPYMAELRRIRRDRKVRR